MTRLAALLALGLGLIGAPTSAQARLVVREAVFEAQEPWLAAPDTTGWERADADGVPLRLGDVLLELGPGTVVAIDNVIDKLTASPTVDLKFAPTTARAFADVTSASVGRPLAIVLDGRVLMAPTVNERIDGGRLVISGAFTQEEVDALVAAIREGTDAGGAD